MSTEASAHPSRSLKGLVDKVVDTAVQTVGAVTGICEDVSDFPATVQTSRICTRDSLTYCLHYLQNVFYLFDATAANTPSQVNAIDLTTGALLDVLRNSTLFSTVMKATCIHSCNGISLACL